MITPELVAYIKKQKDLGVADMTWRGGLLAQGWTESDIMEAVASLTPIMPPPHVQVAPPAQPVAAPASTGFSTIAQFNPIAAPVQPAAPKEHQVVDLQAMSSAQPAASISPVQQAIAQAQKMQVTPTPAQFATAVQTPKTVFTPMQQPFVAAKPPASSK